MKKSLILPLMLLAATQLKAQQSVMFKLAYQPKTTYTIDKDMKVMMNMNLPAEIAAATGGVQDMTMVMNSNTTSVITAGARNQTLMPVTFTMKANTMKMSMNGQDMPAGSIPTPNVAVYGKYTTDSKLLVDSIAGQKMTDSLRAAMSKMLDAVQDGIKFPDHPLKVGETFTQDMPLSLPLPGIGGGNTVNMKMTYKLLRIVGNTAAFDFTENIDLNMNPQVQGQDLKITMIGSGDGFLNYDIAKQFFTTMSNNLSVNFDINTSGVVIKGKGNVVTTDKVVIAGN
jgi:hypothetical protein